MLPYDPRLKQTARRLRRDMTDAERHLWSRIRGKQIQGLQFYRQKPIGSCVVDFFCPAAKLVIEVDGSQHYEALQAHDDRIRTDYLQRCGLQVLRFDNRQVLLETDAVLERILDMVRQQPSGRNPP